MRLHALLNFLSKYLFYLVNRFYLIPVLVSSTLTGKFAWDKFCEM